MINRKNTLFVILSSSGTTSAPRVITWSFGMSEALECVRPGKIQSTPLKNVEESWDQLKGKYGSILSQGPQWYLNGVDPATTWIRWETHIDILPLVSGRWGSPFWQPKNGELVIDFFVKRLEVLRTTPAAVGSRIPQVNGYFYKRRATSYIFLSPHVLDRSVWTLHMGSSKQRGQPLFRLWNRNPLLGWEHEGCHRSFE